MQDEEKYDTISFNDGKEVFSFGEKSLTKRELGCFLLKREKFSQYALLIYSKIWFIIKLRYRKIFQKVIL